MVDANNCFDAARAVQLANRIREFDIFFFEEPVFADDIPGLARFRRGTDIPLATGGRRAGWRLYGADQVCRAHTGLEREVRGMRWSAYICISRPPRQMCFPWNDY
jgi:hypothetical protein